MRRVTFVFIDGLVLLTNKQEEIEKMKQAPVNWKELDEAGEEEFTV